jgi:outer membrane protein TolC
MVGCKSYHNLPETIGNRTTAIDAIMREVDAGVPPKVITDVPAAPVTLRSPVAMDEVTYRDLTLQEAIQIALANSQTLRDIGMTILRTPQAIRTNETKGIVESGPQDSIEAALAAFDAQFYALGKFQNNDRKFNNRFFGGGANAFKQDLHDYVFQMSKRTATGAEFAIRNVIDYDANNATGNLTDSAWQTQIHAEVRQPLLQGGGLTFNRIAGPGSRPGLYNGVLIAKVKNDITGADFEQETRDYISRVINRYWDLYFAYRDLDAKRQAFERSRQTWKSYEAQRTSSRASGAAEALAREQFYRFESELQDAIAGKLYRETPGTFSGLNGVQAAERRLRLQIGLPVTDQTVLRPIDEPLIAPLIFDWDSIASEAIRLRVELEQQRLKIKQREMEVLAAKNFLMPQLDFVGTYRVRGLDKRLAGHDSAFREFARLDFQEYEGSLEMKLPVGFRQGHLAVRNAQLHLSRERRLLEEQERKVLHDLTAVVAECDRAYVQMQTNMNRYLAASDAVASLEANRRAGMPVNVEQLLDSQRRVSESQSNYYLSLVEYAVAAKNVEFEKGTLLESISIFVIDDSHSPAINYDTLFEGNSYQPEAIEITPPPAEADLTLLLEPEDTGGQER